LSRDEIKHLWRTFFARQPAHREAARPRPYQSYHVCRIEPLEGRLAISGVPVTFIPGAHVINGHDVITTDQQVKNWLDTSGNKVAFPLQGAIATIPAGASAEIDIADSATGLQPATFASLICQAAYTIAPQTTSDNIEVDPNNPMDVVVANTSDTVAVTAPIQPLSSGTTVINTTGNFGTFVIQGTATVSSINASAGAFVIDTSANVTAAIVNVSAGQFIVNGNLTVATSMNVSGKPSCKAQSPAFSRLRPAAA